MTTILGLNAYQGDSSAGLFRDGNIVAAAEKENVQAAYPKVVVRVRATTRLV